MKLKITLLFLSIYSLSFGQGLNTEIGFNYDYNQYSRGVACQDEFTYQAYGQNYSGANIMRSLLVKMDTMGNQIWELLIPISAEMTDVDGVISSNEGGVYVFGSGRQTCDISGSCFSFIQKFDGTGGVLSTLMLPDSMCMNFTMSGCSLDDSNQFNINYVDDNGSHIITFDSSLVAMDTLTIPVEELDGISNISGFEQIAYKSDSLFGFDSGGAILNFETFSTQIQDIHSLNDSLFVLTLDSIFLFDNTLQLIASNAFVGFTNYENLKVDNNEIHFVSHGVLNLDVITLNHQLQLLNYLSISAEVPIGERLDFNETHLSISENFNLTMYRTIRYRDYSLQSIVNESIYSTDIELLDVNSTQISASLVNGTSSVYDIYVNAEVLIKNNGVNVLNNCRLNHYITWSIVCFDVVYSEQFSNLNLAPGDSVWVNAGLVHNEQLYFLQNPIEIDICMYSSHPNYKTDLNVANDEICKNIHIGYIGLNEGEINSPRVYPNPSSGILNIDMYEESDYNIYSMQGVLIQKGKVENGQINISNLSSGQYFLDLELYSGQSVKNIKVIKE